MRILLLYLAAAALAVLPACADPRDRSAAARVHAALQPGMALKDVIRIVDAAPRPRSTVVLGDCGDATSYAVLLPTHERGYMVGIWRERDSVDLLEHVTDIKYESLDALLAEVESHHPCGEIYAGFNRWGITMKLDNNGTIADISEPEFTE